VYWQEQLRVFLENGGNGHCRRREKWIFLCTLGYTMKLFMSHCYFFLVVKCVLYSFIVH
jgi:hypothetical protein